MQKTKHLVLIFAALFALGLGGCASLFEDAVSDLQSSIDKAQQEALRKAQEEACANAPEGMPLPEECGGVSGAIKHTPRTRGVVLTASDAAGSLSLVAFADHGVTDDPVPAKTVGADAKGTYQLGALFVLNRDLGNISVINPKTMAVAAQYDAGTNPQTFAAKDGEVAYVTDLGSNKILVLNPFTGAVSESIDLTEYADNDGTAEVSGVLVVGERLFVTLQKLDETTALWDPTGQSSLIVIDVRTQKVETELLLAAQNPVNLRWDASRQRLLVAEVGFYGMTDGGIEMINVDTLKSDGFLVKESDVGGDLSTYAVDATGNVIFVSSDAIWNTTIQHYEASSATVITASTSTGWQYTCGVANDRGEFWVCDRSKDNPGVRIFSIATGEELTSEPVVTALPPRSDIIFLP